VRVTPALGGSPQCAAVSCEPKVPAGVLQETFRHRQTTVSAFSPQLISSSSTSLPRSRPHSRPTRLAEILPKNAAVGAFDAASAQIQEYGTWNPLRRVGNGPPTMWSEEVNRIRIWLGCFIHHLPLPSHRPPRARSSPLATVISCCLSSGSSSCSRTPLGPSRTPL
jgi:hypothetical protein